MHFFQYLRNNICIHLKCRVQQPVRTPDCFHKLLPPAVFHCPDKFLPHFLIRDINFFPAAVIRKVAQMDKQRKHIVSAAHRCHIILKCSCINPKPLSAEHIHNSVFEPVKIQVNVGSERFISFCLCPVIAEFLIDHCLHDRFGIINVSGIIKVISVVPSAGLCKIKPILTA